ADLLQGSGGAFLTGLTEFQDFRISGFLVLVDAGFYGGSQNSFSLSRLFLARRSWASFFALLRRATKDRSDAGQPFRIKILKFCHLVNPVKTGTQPPNNNHLRPALFLVSSGRSSSGIRRCLFDRINRIPGFQDCWHSWKQAFIEVRKTHFR
ncbi:hypothetical protein, partial [Prosthecobacter sp.]|uniref:hypothetical protein n=1 Tax=Prosthecobacter sp. TaxID=1965333 RepID=UPI0024870BC5